VEVRFANTLLNLVIDEIYSNKKTYLEILNDLADIIAKLHSNQFKYMGNIENKDNELTIVSPIEFPLSVISKPCDKFSDYAFAWLSYYMKEMKRLQCVNHPNQQYFSEFIPRLENILETKNFCILDDPRDLFVYCHQDFVMKNILIDNSHVSAVLDWEWSGPALPEFEIQTGFDFLYTEEDRKLFEDLMSERGFPHFFRPPPPKRELFYDLIGHLYALISCYEWIEGKLDHSAKFLAQKLEQRMAKKTENFNMDKFAEEKAKIIDQTLKTIESLQNKDEVSMKPIALFGLSGVGKTTLAHALVDLAPDQFSILPIITSRSPRSDDDPHYIEFLSQADFMYYIEQGLFSLWWHQDGNYYGYKHKHFKSTKTHPIMTCSLSAVRILKEFGAVNVLIKGDSIKGLESRGSSEVIKNRTLLNIKNTDAYLNQTWFKENIDIEHEQIWGDLPRSVQKLYDSIKNSCG
jgi:guanylate kinase